MFCPQCSHQQAFNETRFCSRCGLPLGIVTDLLGNSSDQLQREKREMTGIGLMLATRYRTWQTQSFCGYGSFLFLARRLLAAWVS